jgi:error-prone DNA polymerase
VVLEMAFAELLGCSSFSFLRGASHPSEIVEQAKLLDLEALALCDRDGIYGVARAHKRAREVGQRLIIGAELVASTQKVERLSEEGLAKRKARAWADTTPTLALLAQDHAGYVNLCRLLTLAHAGLPKGESVLEVEMLERHHQGLIALVPAPVAFDAPGWSPKQLRSIREIFEERSFLVAYRRLDPCDTLRFEWLRETARMTGAAIVASARPLFHDRTRQALADVLHCIRNCTTLDDAGAALQINSEARLRSDVEMRRLFREYPKWVDRSVEIAAEAKFNLAELKYEFPCTLEPGVSADQKLSELVWEGAARRYPAGIKEEVRTQLEKELEIIAQLDVAPYFLSTWEVVQIAVERRILCQGRGSAANSAVCYVLGITAVDPSCSTLLFERFLSRERQEPPDIDVDFEHERREEVIQEIYRRYGRDRAAMVSEVICYRGKSALREVGKAFGLSLAQVDRLSSELTSWSSAKEVKGRVVELGFERSSKRLMQVVQLAEQLEGFPRHLSIHVGGFVLSAKPLTEVAPIEPGRMLGRSVIPWDKDDIEALGLFKIDVLGLGMLSAIRKALELVFATGGLREAPSFENEAFDPLEVFARVKQKDPAVYALVSEADTVGVFQIESRAQMAMLPRLRPQDYYDLVIEVALVRPGPIQGGMVHPYLRRRRGEEAIDSIHPDIDPILERTLGVPLFQEQVMQLAIVGAGYSGGEADQLRRDMAAWRKTGNLERHKEKLLAGFSKKGISREFAERIFEQIKGFGDYGFPESHAASFAHLVYVSAWLKAHYPAHFACALINAQPMGFYAPSTLVRDAQGHGVEVREVNVLYSSWDCRLEPATETCGIQSADQTALRLGFRLLKGLSLEVAESIVSARRQKPFQSIADFSQRARLNKRQLEGLAEAGALECLAAGRRNALWKTKAPSNGELFVGLDANEPRVELPALRAVEQLSLDYGHVGLSLEDHPMNHLRAKLKGRRVTPAIRLVACPQGALVRVAGYVLSRQRPATASGIVFITLEDETGIVNLVLHAGIFRSYGATARHAKLMLAEGKLERQLTIPKKPEHGKPTPVIHVIAQYLERLELEGAPLPSISRDFH